MQNKDCRLFSTFVLLLLQIGEIASPELAVSVTHFPGGALGYFMGGHVPPETPNWHPVLKIISPKIDTPF